MALAIDLVMVENKTKLRQMMPYYERRKISHVRANHAIGDRVLSRAMTKLNKMRAAKKTPEQRSKQARIAALARWSA